MLNLYDALARVPGRRPGAHLRRARLQHAHLARPGEMARLGVTASDIVERRARAERAGSPPGSIGAAAGAAGAADAVHGDRARPADRRGAVREHRPAVEPDGGRAPQGRRAASSSAPPITHRSSRNDGQAGALIGIFLQPDANALDVAKRVTRAMAKIEPTLPAGHGLLDPVDTTTPFVTESIKEVVNTLFEAVRARRARRVSCSCRAGARR